MEGEWRLATGIPARLTPAEGRKFGLLVGGAFLLFATISWWRGHDVAPLVLGGLGGALTVLGLAIPGRLGPVYRAWMGLAHLLSRVTTPIFLGIVYFLVITPMGWLLRLLKGNPLVHRPGDTGYWAKREPNPDPSRSLTRQF